MPRGRLSQLIGISLVALLLLTGCGITGASKSPEQRLAEALLPQASDFPAGWVTIPQRIRANGACRPAAKGAVEAEAVEFLRRRGRFQLHAGSQSFVTEAQAKTAFTQYTARSVVSCLADALYQTLAGSMVPSDMALVGAASVGPLQLRTTGDGSMAYRVEISVTGPRRTYTLYIDYVVFRVRRGVAWMGAAGLMHPVDSALIESLMARAADRGAKTASS